MSEPHNPSDVDRGQRSIKGLVLVVDDDPVVLRITKARLQGAGYQVVVRSEALGTSHAIANDKPDVVLLDLNMPGMNGLDVCRELKADERTRDIPVVIMSAQPEADLKAAVESSGAVGYIEKGTSVDDMVKTLQAHLPT